MILAEADNTTWLMWLALSAICLTALVVIAARRQQFLNWAVRTDRRDQRLAQRERRETEALATDVLQQFEQVSRRLSDELADKSRQLRELIALADQRVALANQETGSGKREADNAEQESVEHSPPAAMSPLPAPCSPPTAPPAPTILAERTSDAIELSILGNRLTVPARRRREEIGATAPSPALTQDSPPILDDLPPTMLRVWELADQGISPSDIADQTGLMLGEVELLLNLRKLT